MEKKTCLHWELGENHWLRSLLSECALSYLNTKPLRLSFKPRLVTQRDLAAQLSAAGRQLMTAPRSLCLFLPRFGRMMLIADRGPGHWWVPSAAVPQMGVRYPWAPAAVSASPSLPPLPRKWWSAPCKQVQGQGSSLVELCPDPEQVCLRSRDHLVPLF